MQMEVEHGLTRSRSVVDRQTERVAAAHLLGDLAGGQHQVPQQYLIIRFGVAQAWNDFARYQQHVYRRTGVDVLERYAVFILVDDVRGQFAGDYFLEQGFLHDDG